MTDWKELCRELSEHLALLDEPPHELVCRAQGALAQPEPEVEGELTDQELLRCANIGTPCYDLKAWERELRMMRAAISSDRARWGHQPAPPAEGRWRSWCGGCDHLRMRPSGSSRVRLKPSSSPAPPTC